MIQFLKWNYVCSFNIKLKTFLEHTIYFARLGEILKKLSIINNSIVITYI